MFKKHIRNIVKEEIEKQDLQNTLDKTHRINWKNFYEEQIRNTEKLVTEKENYIT